jgi:hypothetical protein
MFKMNNYMASVMLNSFRNVEPSGHINQQNNYLVARLYTGGDLSPAEITALNNAPQPGTGAIFAYTRNYESAFATLTSTRTLLARTPATGSSLIQRFQNVGSSSDKSVWRLSQLAPLSVIASGTAGLLVIYLTSNPGTENICRALYTFTVGLPGSGAEIELTETTLTTDSQITLNDIEIDYQGLM